ncbi:MAG: hypothetical protein ACPGNV_08525 [Mangrovicoccus sp.]
MRETRRHLSSFTRVYLADDKTMLGNLGFYLKGQIWLAEKFEGRMDIEVEEILHHEIFHMKFALAKARHVLMAGMTMDEAMAQAGLVAPTALADSPRAELIEYYRLNAGPDFDEECLVQLCLAVRFNEPAALPDRLYAACEALVRPLSIRPAFWGGYIGSSIYGFRKLRRWGRHRPLPGLLPPYASGFILTDRDSTARPSPHTA